MSTYTTSVDMDHSHTVTIPTSTQRDVHIISEAAALLVAAPFLFYVGATSKRRGVRQFATALGVATVAIDGWLLYQYLR